MPSWQRELIVEDTESQHWSWAQSQHLCFTLPHRHARTSTSVDVQSNPRFAAFPRPVWCSHLQGNFWSVPGCRNALFYWAPFFWFSENSQNSESMVFTFLRPILSHLVLYLSSRLRSRLLTPGTSPNARAQCCWLLPGAQGCQAGRQDAPSHCPNSSMGADLPAHPAPQGWEATVVNRSELKLA